MPCLFAFTPFCASQKATHYITIKHKTEIKGLAAATAPRHQGLLLGCRQPARTHQVLGAVQLVRGGGAARDERLEHAAHHHCLHVLRHRLVVPRGEVIAEACLVWKQQGDGGGETTDHTGGKEVWFSGEHLSTAKRKNTEPKKKKTTGRGVGKGRGKLKKGSIKHMWEWGEISKLKRILGRD